MANASILSVIQSAESAGARVGLCAILPDGTRVTHRENEQFITASTIKIAIMIELYRRLDAGTLKLADVYTLTEEDICPGSGIMQGLHIGSELTLADLCYLMMSISDNTATNVLIDYLGKDEINATMRELGLTEAILARKMRGGPATVDEGENLGSPAEFAMLIEAILAGKAASAESCMAMLETLKTQANSRRIGRFVPAGMEWGSKTGSHTTTVNDVGFVMTKDGPLVLAVFVEKVRDVVEGELFISEIVRSILATVEVT